MIVVIVNSGNFQPRVLSLPKEDFPEDHLELFMKHSHEKRPNRHLLIQQVIWDNNGCGKNIQTEWSNVANLIYSIVDGFHDPPEWCRNATFDCDHGYFNSDLIEITGAEIFEVVEEHVYPNNTRQFNTPLCDTVDELEANVIFKV